MRRARVPTAPPALRDVNNSRGIVSSRDRRKPRFFREANIGLASRVELKAAPVFNGRNKSAFFTNALMPLQIGAFTALRGG